jgi:hypothetical protein
MDARHSGIGRCNQDGILAASTHRGQWRFLLSSRSGEYVARIVRSEIRDRPMNLANSSRVSLRSTRATTMQATSFSRGIPPPSFATFPRMNEGAERRQALGCLRGTRSRASDAGPQASTDASHPAQIRLRSLRDARLSALHCGDLLAPSLPWRNGRASGALGFALVRSHDPLVVADGRCCPDASRGRGYEPARRTPHPAPTLARLRRRPR